MRPLVNLNYNRIALEDVTSFQYLLIVIVFDKPLTFGMYLSRFYVLNCDAESGLLKNDPIFYRMCAMLMVCVSPRASACQFHLSKLPVLQNRVLKYIFEFSVQFESTVFFKLTTILSITVCPL